VAYATISELKSYAGITDARHDGELAQNLLSAQREIDTFCHRSFDVPTSATARVFVVDDEDELILPYDIADTTGLIIVDNGVTLSGSNYQLEPLNGIGSNGEARPYYVVRRLGTSWSSPQYEDQASVTITARWGWPAVPANVKQSTLVLASRTFKLKDAPLGVAGFGEFGSVRVRDIPQIKMWLEPYVRADLTYGIGGG
jgi:hypothetical protein